MITMIPSSLHKQEVVEPASACAGSKCSDINELLQLVICEDQQAPHLLT